MKFLVLRFSLSLKIEGFLELNRFSQLIQHPKKIVKRKREKRDKSLNIFLKEEPKKSVSCGWAVVFPVSFLG